MWSLRLQNFSREVRWQLDTTGTIPKSQPDAKKLCKAGKCGKILPTLSRSMIGFKLIHEIAGAPQISLRSDDGEPNRIGNGGKLVPTKWAVVQQST